MTESLLDSAIDTCHEALSRMSDVGPTRELLARLHILERTCATVSLDRDSAPQIVQLARLALSLREEIFDALLLERRARQSRDRHPPEAPRSRSGVTA